MEFDSFIDDVDNIIKFGVKLYTRNFDSINMKLRTHQNLTVIENIVLKCMYIECFQLCDHLMKIL